MSALASADVDALVACYETAQVEGQRTEKGVTQRERTEAMTRSREKTWAALVLTRMLFQPTEAMLKVMSAPRLLPV